MTLNNCVFKALIVLSDTLSLVADTLAVKLVVLVFSVVRKDSSAVWDDSVCRDRHEGHNHL